MNLENLDWYIIFGYLVCLILLSVYLSKDQKNLKDYFVASRKQKSKKFFFCWWWFGLVEI